VRESVCALGDERRLRIVMLGMVLCMACPVLFALILAGIFLVETYGFTSLQPLDDVILLLFPIWIACGTLWLVTTRDDVRHAGPPVASWGGHVGTFARVAAILAVCITALALAIEPNSETWTIVVFLSVEACITAAMGATTAHLAWIAARVPDRRWQRRALVWMSVLLTLGVAWVAGFLLLFATTQLGGNTPGFVQFGAMLFVYATPLLMVVIFWILLFTAQRKLARILATLRAAHDSKPPPLALDPSGTSHPTPPPSQEPPAP
jgi:hypothetical protein